MIIGGESSRSGVPLQAVVEYLDDLLETLAIPDYPNAFNGLQLANRGTVTKVAAAVDFSAKTVDAAIEQSANLLVVHHGMFWAGAERFVGKKYERLRTAIDNDVAVYSSHLPLDRHPIVGNNVLLARALNLQPSDGFARFKDVF